MSDPWAELEKKYGGATTATAATPNDPWSALEQKYLPGQAARAQQQPESPMSAVPESTGERLAAGAGSMVTDFGLGAKQAIYQLMANEQNKMAGIGGKISSALGIPDFNKKVQGAYQEVADKRALDAPLLDTTAGKVGRVLGAVGAAVPTMLIPGASTLGGSVLSGMAMGAAEPRLQDESLTKNAMLGGAGGAAGYGVAKAIGSAGSAMATRNAAKIAESSPMRDTLEAARSVGYKFDPTATNPTLLNRALSGTAGKTNLAQRASMANQQITNELAAVDIGLSKAKSLTPELIESAKAVPAKVYDQMRAAGEVPVSDAYMKTLDNITQKYAGASKSFAMDNPIAPIVEPFKVKSFDSSAAVDAIALLREKASQAFRQGNNDVGRAQRAVASALEEELSKAPNAAPELLDAFRKARTTFAKIHSVENALNPATGDVSARKIGAEFAKGKPLTGNLSTIGRTQQAFPKSMATIGGESMPGITPFDMMTGTVASGASGNPAWLASMLSRPILQNGLMSGVGQWMGSPSMPSQMLPNLLQSRLLQDSARYGLLGNVPQLSQ